MEYLNRIGRRKEAIARVYLKEGSGKITVNGKDYKEYFTTPSLLNKAVQSFEVTDTLGKFDTKVNLKGGGITGQVEAMRMAIARALTDHDPELRGILKAEGFLRRDPRMVERKKPGQPGARKKFQFSKR
jgi:small subunit ribosomal protein S9